MAENALASLKTNAQRLGARLGENLAEHSRDLGLVDGFASGSGGGSGKYLENGAALTTAGIEETKKMLASKRESDRMDGLKRVAAMMTKNLPVTSFFPLVTSLLSPSTPLQARSLISLYIIHCASTAPELALLSINAYQKDLSDPNPIVRAGAIKTLSSMNLPDIRSLVGVAIGKGARDGSWYVRRATADAVVALYRADPASSNRHQLLPTLVVLLNSASPLTIGSALSAWEELCPSRWDLIHPVYRKWCRMLMDVEEWGQVVLLRVLLRYGRTFFLDPASTGAVDADAELLLKTSHALLQHMNPAVVSAVVKVYYYLAPSDRLSKIVRPLLRLLKASPEVQSVALEDCAIVADSTPSLLAEHITDFFVRFSEVLSIKTARLRIIVALTSAANVQLVMRELLTYVKDVDGTFSAEAIKAIGTCAQRVPAVSEDCIKTLVELTQSKYDTVIAQSVLVLRSLLRSPHLPSSTSRTKIITRLVDLLEAGRINSPTARATIYWLVGQYSIEGLVSTVAPDVVRFGALNFAHESDSAKLQLLTLSAKAVIASQATSSTPYLRELALLFDYLTTLARYDLTYEVRDRARFLKGILNAAGAGKSASGKSRIGLAEEDFKAGVMVEDLTGEHAQAGDEKADENDDERTMTLAQASRILFDGKTFASNEDSSSTSSAELGSFALALPTKRLAFEHASAYSSVPHYPETVPPASIRDPPISLDPSPTSSRPHSRSPTPLRGFGSDSLPHMKNNGSGPVVLTPTNFANESGGAKSRDLSPATGGHLQQLRRKGFTDLEDFYKDDDESSEEEDEDEDDESGDEEQQSESGEEECGDDEDEDEEEKTEDEEGDEDVEEETGDERTALHT